jgi:hypothetical protein
LLYDRRNESSSAYNMGEGKLFFGPPLPIESLGFRRITDTLISLENGKT